MLQRLLSYKNSVINYYRFGSGPSIAVAFHGYGEDGTLYSFFEKYLGSQFSFYCIDLPFHGKTEWKEGLLFTHRDLLSIITDVIQRDDSSNEIDDNQKKQAGLSKASALSMPGFSIIGFSLGGRIALSLYQASPESINKIILFAPDGLRINPWYWFATQTLVGNRIFAFSMKNPGWFLGFLRLVNKLGLVNASILKFVNYYIGHPEARSLLYRRWTTLRKLKPNTGRIKSLIPVNKTQVRLVYGKYDRIILPVRGEAFQKGIEQYCTITVIDSGHQVVHENHMNQILPALAG